MRVVDENNIAEIVPLRQKKADVPVGLLRLLDIKTAVALADALDSGGSFMLVTKWVQPKEPARVDN